MNYQQMQSALLQRQSLTAIFNGTVYYRNGDEYPIISYPPYEIISTGSMNHFYFDQKNDGLPLGVREVCFSDRSPYAKKKENFDRAEIYEFHAQGVLPDFILDGLVGDGLSYTWKGKQVTGLEKVEEVIEDEFSSYHLVREGMIEIYSGANNPSNLHLFKLKYPYLWYFTCKYPREKIFVHHENSSYKALLSKVLSLI